MVSEASMAVDLSALNPETNIKDRENSVFEDHFGRGQIAGDPPIPGFKTNTKDQAGNSRAGSFLEFLWKFLMILLLGIFLHFFEISSLLSGISSVSSGISYLIPG